MPRVPGAWPFHAAMASARDGDDDSGRRGEEPAHPDLKPDVLKIAIAMFGKPIVGATAHFHSEPVGVDAAEPRRFGARRERHLAAHRIDRASYRKIDIRTSRRGCVSKCRRGRRPAMGKIDDADFN